MRLTDLPERWQARIEPEPMSGCWLWPGNHSYGYGYFSRWKDGKLGRERAHRMVYRFLVGEIPADKVLDHLCRVRCCVNPAHLRVCTPRENSAAPGSKHVCLRTECPKGHPYSGHNLRYARNGTRRCRECHRLNVSARRKANPKPYNEATRRWRARNRKATVRCD